MKKFFEIIRSIIKYLIAPPPSKIIFYVLVIVTAWLSLQVEIQGHIIKRQMDDINYLLSLLRHCQVGKIIP